MQLRLAACLYVLSDPCTNEIRYVGWTSKRPTDRLAGHLAQARSGNQDNHRCKWLRSLLSNGQHPVMRVAAWMEIADAPIAEIRYIAILRAAGTRLVNSTDGGEGTLGRFHGAETRSRISAALIGRRLSPEHRATISRIQAGRKKPPRTVEWRRKQSVAQSGKHPAEKTRLKLSLASKGKKRRPFTAEHRQAISAARRGKPLSAAVHDAARRVNLGSHQTPEHRARISAATKGLPKTPEHRAKLAVANRGKKLTPEHRQRISDGLRAHRDRRQVKGVV